MDVKKTIDLSIQFGEDMPTEGTMHDYTVRMTEMLRGDKAWDKLKTVSGNQPAPEGYDYVLVKFRITLKAVASSTRWFDEFEYVSGPTDWVAFSADGTRYAYAQAQTPEPQMLLSLNPGDTKDGYIVAIVAKTDATPYMEDVKNNLYFALY